MTGALAGKLGIGSAETLRKWIRQAAEVDGGTRPGVTSEESAEIRRLKREVAELRRANEILKAASVFFAAELDRPYLRSCGAAGALVEGILARIVEAADQSRDLPDREADGFLCGMEFLTLAEEHRYFARHGLRLAAAEEEVVLTEGQLLLFDNLAVGHGRRGRRNAGELHQLCIGFGSLDLAGQAAVLNRFLSGFNSHAGHADAVAVAPEP